MGVFIYIWILCVLSMCMWGYLSEYMHVSMCVCVYVHACVRVRACVRSNIWDSSTQPEGL